MLGHEAGGCGFDSRCRRCVASSKPPKNSAWATSRCPRVGDAGLHSLRTPGLVQAPHPQEGLSDNGPVYTAKDTGDERPSATHVLTRLPAWFDDDNRGHPHRVLKMKSPREFRAAHSQP